MPSSTSLTAERINSLIGPAPTASPSKQTPGLDFRIVLGFLYSPKMSSFSCSTPSFLETENSWWGGALVVIRGGVRGIPACNGRRGSLLHIIDFSASTVIIQLAFAK